MDDVKVHYNSDKPAQLQAHAYAQGTDIHLGAGQEKHLAHEAWHVVQQKQGRVKPTVQMKGKVNVNDDKGLEREADEMGVKALQMKGDINHNNHSSLNSTIQNKQSIQRKEENESKSDLDKIKELLSYAYNDFAVTKAEEVEILKILNSTANLSKIIKDLDAEGYATLLISRVDVIENRRVLIQLLGSDLDETAKNIVLPYIKRLEGGWEMQFNMGSLGVKEKGQPFDRSTYDDLVSKDSSNPFTGSGASGINPKNASISLYDQGLLYFENEAAEQEYRNPLGDLRVYLNSLSADDRQRQVELLVRQPISSAYESSYDKQLPSRLQVINAAAKTYQLEPELITAFILAEQRDQSKKEDAKDYVGATRGGGNTSIGLGQVVVSTAKDNDLFKDLLSSDTRKNLDHDRIAQLLASDEFNIFAVAKYIRQIADEGALFTNLDLPKTVGIYPNIDMPTYAKHSSNWSEHNIEAMASEYTSIAWDDRIFPYWAYMVLESYKDVKSAGLF